MNALTWIPVAVGIVTSTFFWTARGLAGRGCPEGRCGKVRVVKGCAGIFGEITGNSDLKGKVRFGKVISGQMWNYIVGCWIILVDTIG
jgi:hypothetical protein